MASNISQKLNSVMKGVQNDINKSIWEVCKEYEVIVKEKLQEIIESSFYDSVQESDYYDRTYSLLNSVSVKATQGGGHYRLNVKFDIGKLNSIIKDIHETGKFSSYGYSYGKYKGLKLNYQQKQEWVVDYYNEKYGFTDNLLNFYQKTFSENFEKDLKIKIKKYRRSTYS